MKESDLNNDHGRAGEARLGCQPQAAATTGDRFWELTDDYVSPWDKLAARSDTAAAEMTVAGSVKWEVGDLMVALLPGSLRDTSAVLRITGVNGCKLAVTRYGLSAAIEEVFDLPADTPVRRIGRAPDDEASRNMEARLRLGCGPLMAAKLSGLNCGHDIESHSLGIADPCPPIIPDHQVTEWRIPDGIVTQGQLPRLNAKLYSAADFAPEPAPRRTSILHRLSRVPMIQWAIRRVWAAASRTWRWLEDYRIPE